jgi:hypothetical protein
MRTLSLIGVAVLAALGSSPAWAQSSSPSAQAPAADAPKKVIAKDPEEVVCIRQELPGSRVPGPKECHTRRVWDQISQDARDNAQDLQMRSGQLQTQKGG